MRININSVVTRRWWVPKSHNDAKKDYCGVEKGYQNVGNKHALDPRLQLPKFSKSNDNIDNKSVLTNHMRDISKQKVPKVQPQWRHIQSK